MIPVAEPLLGESELRNVVECIKSGWISSRGSYITEFEKQFSRYCGVRYGVTTTSGTTALHLALAALGLGKGDEVILPAFTMIASASAIVYTGAKPVLVDAEPDTWNMDVSKIEEKITERTRAILPVHIYGHPVDMDPLLEMAQEHSLYVVEDAAEVHGAEYKGRKAGGLGDAGCFSFYANKIITTGEGGMVVTDDERIYERASLLKDLAFTKDRTYVHRALGYNYRMTNLQAAIGLAQLERIEENVAIKRRNAALYNRLLGDIDGITTPTERPWAKNVYWMYSVLVEDAFGMTRDKLRARLLEKGVDSRAFFVPMHLQPVFQEMGLFRGESYPVAEELSRKGLYLPSGLTLTEEQIRQVCGALAEIKKEATG